MSTKNIIIMIINDEKQNNRILFNANRLEISFNIRNSHFQSFRPIDSKRIQKVGPWRFRKPEKK